MTGTNHGTWGPQAWRRNKNNYMREEKALAKLEETIEVQKSRADRRKIMDWLNDVIQHRKNFRDFHDKVVGSKPPVSCTFLVYTCFCVCIQL